MHQGILHYVPAQQRVIVKMWHPGTGFNLTINTPTQEQMKAQVKWWEKKGYVVVG